MPPQLSHLYRWDHSLGVYDPIVYLSDFWQLNRDLILLDETSIDRIASVRNGEKQEGDDTMSEKQIENLNFNGKLRLTWDNYSTTYLIYQEMFKLS